jgi:hypothetical protein
MSILQTVSQSCEPGERREAEENHVAKGSSSRLRKKEKANNIIKVH